MHFPSISSLPRSVLVPAIVVTGACLVIACVHLLTAITMVLHGTMDVDVRLYITAGKVFTNGLTLYKDIYETKPPGMFLFSAISLLLTGGNALLMWFEVLFLALLPVAAGIFAYRECREWTIFPRLWLTASVALIAVIFMLYLEERASGLEVDSFAVFLSSLFVLITLSLKPSRKRLVITSLLAVSAVTMKETYVIILFTAALLFCRSPKDSIGTLILPLIIGGVVSILLFAFLGILGPYVTIHLPIMLFEQARVDTTFPLFYQALNARVLFVNLTTLYQPMPLLGYFAGFLWMMSPLYHSHEKSPAAMLRTVLAGVFGYLALLNVAFMLALHSLRAQGIFPAPASEIVMEVKKGWIILPIFAVLLWIQWKKGALIRTLLSIAVLFLLTYTVVASGMSGNHFAAMTVIIFTLLLLSTRYIVRTQNSAFLTILLTLSAVCILPFSFSTQHREQWASGIENTRVAKEGKADAAALDALLDACNVSQFVGEGLGRLLYTRHPVMGPFPSPANFAYLRADHPLQIAMVENRKNAKVYVTETPAPPEDIPAEEITTDPPSCAGDLLPVGQYTVWFRKSAFQ